jgi:cytochrome c peroxidase
MKSLPLSRILVCGLLLFLAAGAWTSASAELSPLEQLGKELFFDKISSPQNQSCATCHAPSAGWVGAIPGINLHGGVYPGANKRRFGDRKPPSSAYVTSNPVVHLDAMTGEFVGGIFWDGRATGERLGSPAAEQALGPFLNPVEQNMPSKTAVCEHVAGAPYAALYEEVWGEGSLDCSEFGVEAMYDRIGLSIAAYEASSEVNPFSSKFDAYWNACIDAGNSPEECGLAAGDQAVLDPMSFFTAQEFDGLIEFGEYCSPCHVSHEYGPNGENPLFTDFRYDNIGVPRNPKNPFYDMDRVYLDNGMPINPLGDDFVDYGLGAFLRTRPEWAHLAEQNDGKFKVPSVRNVDKRPGVPADRPDDPEIMAKGIGPVGGFPKVYMHNGAFKSLEEVVHFYNTRDLPEENWPAPEVPQNVNREIFEGVPLGDFQLDLEAERAIVAFLGTLSDGYFDPATSTMAVKQPNASSKAIGDLIGRGLNAKIIASSGEIRFELPNDGVVEVTVYDIRGRRVNALGVMRMPAGANTITWDGRDEGGQHVSNGVYHFRVRTAFTTETVKGLWLR